MEVKEHLQTLSTALLGLVGNMREIVEAAKVEEDPDKAKSRAQIDRDTFRTRVMTENLIVSAQSIVSMTTDLKHGVAMLDTVSVNREIEEERAKYRDRVAGVEAATEELANEIDAALYELEEAYYSSASRRIPDVLD